MTRRSFEILPAIDLMGGRVVRLRQGRARTELCYSSDPIAVAQQFADAGALALHVIDLDGALGGESVHLPVIARICRLTRLPIRFGGGLRREEDIEAAFAAGAAVAILGTAAIEQFEAIAGWLVKFGPRLAVSLDVREGVLRTRGWMKGTGVRLEDAAAQLARAGLTDLVVTDVAGDGELSGPDIALFERAAEAFGAPVLAAGGIASSEDVARLRERPGVRGAVLGRALYEGRIPLTVLRGGAA